MKSGDGIVHPDHAKPLPTCQNYLRLLPDADLQNYQYSLLEYPEIERKVPETLDRTVFEQYQIIALSMAYRKNEEAEYLAASKPMEGFPYIIKTSTECLYQTTK